MRVTAISTIGVRVKNASTGDYSFMYVSQYFLAYRREGDKKWRRYHRNDVSVTVRIKDFYMSFGREYDYTSAFCLTYVNTLMRQARSQGLSSHSRE